MKAILNGIVRIIFVLYLLASIIIALVGIGGLMASRGAGQEIPCTILFGIGFIGFILGFCVDYLNGIYFERKKNSETQLYEMQKTNRQLQEFLSRIQ